MWHAMFAGQIPLAEKILRTVIVYGLLAVLFRLIGKQGLASMNTFDLVVTFLLSSVAQNAVIGNETSPRHRPASSPTYRRNPHNGSRIVAVVSAGCLLAPEPLLAAHRNAGSAAGCAADLGGLVPAAGRPRQLSGSRTPVSRQSLPVPATAADQDKPFNTARRP
jgi:hypothetical protein